MNRFNPTSNKPLILALTFFIILSFLVMSKHEAWRDEAQSWLIARDYPNIGSVINHMHYERTPALWHLVLFPLAKSGLPYSSLFILNFLIIFAAVAIFFTCSPFTLLQKILFIFGYFIFYEYSIIARCYSLIILLLFLTAIIYKERFNKTIIYPLLLFLLANTHVLGMVIAVVLSGAYIFELIQRKRLWKRKYISFYIIVILALAVAVYQLVPAKDFTPDFSRWNFNITLNHLYVLSDSIVSAFLPIPEFKLDFWESKIVYYPFIFLDDFEVGVLRLAIGSILFLLSIGFFIRKLNALLIYLLSTGIFFSIFLLRYSGEMRHYGLIFIIFIFSLWISREYKESSLINNKIANWLFSPKKTAFYLSILLFFHFTASFVAGYYELKYDFSAGKKVAAFLKDNRLINDDTFIITYQSFAASAILPYIPKPHSQFYYSEYKDFRSFMLWNKEYSLNENLTPEEIVDRTKNAVKNKNYKTVLFISNRYIFRNILEIGKKGKLSARSKYYTDRSYTIRSQPADFEKLTAILTSNDNKYATDEVLMMLTLKEPATVYIAYDRRATSLPTWFKGFTPTGMKIYTTDMDMKYFNLYKKEFPQGNVVLGGNWQGCEENGAGSHYIFYVNSSDFEVKGAVKGSENFSLLTKFNKTIVRSESFFIYQYRLKDSNSDQHQKMPHF